MGGSASHGSRSDSDGDPQIWLGEGARAAEDELLRRLEAVFEGTPRDAWLAAPVRVLVPSGSLREHLAGVLVRRRPSWLGLEVQTLTGAARSLVERDPRAVARDEREGERLLPILARRAVRADPDLARDLGGLEDAEGPVVAVIRDLLDAGFETHHREPALDAIAEAGGDPRTVARARALVRVAARVQDEAARTGVEPRSAVFLRAVRILEREGPAFWPSRAVLVHGVADATGVVAEWIATLVRVMGASVGVPAPPDLAFAGAGGRPPLVGGEFTRRLCERLGEPSPASAGSRPEPTIPVLHAAAGAAAEVRGVAEAVRRALDDGTPPERIGVVARELRPYRLAISAQFRRLGLPFSGGRGFPTRQSRRLRALLDVLARGGEHTVDGWLDATDRYAGAALSDLRLGLHGLGVGRLRDLADLDLGDVLGARASLRLPAVRGLARDHGPRPEDLEFDAEPPPGNGEPPAGNGEPPPGNGEQAPGETPPSAPVRRLARRHVSRAQLAWAVDGAAATLRWLSQRGEGAASEHAAGLRRLTRELWHWDAGTDGSEPLADALRRLEAGLAPTLPLTADEFLLLLRRELDGAGEAPLGGEGAGVQVLDAMEARGRTFEALFVLGMNRDVFPRAIVDDPWLPDRMRVALEPVLPEIPIKRRGFAEERHLFAWLCSAAPRLTLSWQAVTDDGKERPRSPLIERLLLAAPGLETTRVSLPWLQDGELRPAFEHALRAGLTGSPADQAAVLGVLLPAEEAAARRAVQDEFEARGDRRDLPGPYSGFVGPEAGDDPMPEVFVTRLESLTFCPWRSFLERDLGLQPMPDALAALPDVSALLVGNVCHDVLERMIAEAGGQVGGALEASVDAAPVDVPWPDAPTLDAWLLEAARHAAAREGILLPAFAHFLAGRARPFLARVAELEAEDGVMRGVLGAELEGAVSLRQAEGRDVTLRFRADRVDRTAKGLRLVDYKTGGPVSTAKQPKTRAAHLLRGIHEGRRLQVAAYAAVPAGGREVEGRYVFARPDLADAHALVALQASDEAARDAFTGAALRLLAARGDGVFPPRLLNADGGSENSFCTSCDVAEACQRGDSGARRRQVSWVDRSDLPDPAPAARGLLRPGKAPS